MKTLLLIMPLLCYYFISKWLMRVYFVKENTVVTVFIISIPIFIIYAFIYEFSITTLLYSILISILLSITAIDLDKKLIPNKLVFVVFLLGFINLFFNRVNYKLFLGGLLLASTFSLLIYIISKRGFGGGDVKLISSLGLILGYYNVCLMLLIAFSFSVLIGLAMIGFKKATFKSSMPFGPFITLGVLVLMFI